MSLVDRIRTEHHTSAMVAADTIDLLTERVQRLLSYGRRIAMTERYTYTGDSPDLHVGLNVHRIQTGGDFLDVRLEPGFHGFGFGVIDHATEETAWKAYHAGEEIPASHFERRKNMTEVTLTGGRENDGPGRDDGIVVRYWNNDGVCTEKVIAFDEVAQ